MFAPWRQPCCDAAESVELYSGLRNKDFIKTGFHEHLYGVWSFEINAEYLIIRKGIGVRASFLTKSADHDR